MKANEFEMIVFDVFHLQGGRTVFVGSVKGLNKLIQKCQVEVLVNEKIYKIIEIEGEWFFNAQHPEGHRAISTTASINLTTDIVKKQQCKLRMLS